MGGKHTLGYHSSAAKESGLSKLLITEQGHPGSGGELHLVAIGHSLAEEVAAVKVFVLEQAHHLGVVLNVG